MVFEFIFLETHLKTCVITQTSRFFQLSYLVQDMLKFFLEENAELIHELWTASDDTGNMTLRDSYDP
jgi:hypothetical protein